MSIRTVLAVVVLLGTAASAHAHATWISQRAGEWAVVHGEGSATDEAYDPAKVTSLAGRDKAGNPVEVTRASMGGYVTVKAPEAAAVLVATYDAGWWTEDATGEWHNAAADAYPDFKGTGHYRTYISTYVAPTEMRAPVGHLLEIVPLADPVSLSIGGKLPVKVLFDGKPLEGATVTNDVLTDWDISAAATDAEGKTTIVVANSGLNVAQVYHEVDAGPKTIEGHQAVLSFVSAGTKD